MLKRHGETEVAARDTASCGNDDDKDDDNVDDDAQSWSPSSTLLFLRCLLSLFLSPFLTHTFRLFLRSVIWTARRVAIGPRKGSPRRNGVGARETTDELGRDRRRRGRRRREGVTVAFQREL